MIATRADWLTKPLPTQHATLALDGTITLTDYEQIVQGYVPQNTADKWFLFFENGAIHVHRAATGSCIFQLPLIRCTDHYAVSTLIVNRDPTQYRTVTDQYDLELCAWLIDHYLLKRNTPFPQPPRLAKNHHQAHQQHIIGRTPTPPTNTPLISLDTVAVPDQPHTDHA